MSEHERPPVGTIGWIDLTVEDAVSVRDFYAHVCTWETSAFDMGGYEDFCMHPPASDDHVAGVCHSRGTNAQMPGGWMMYVVVPDAHEAAERAEQRGGEVVVEPKPVMDGHMAIIKDPAGHHFGVMSWPDHP